MADRNIPVSLHTEIQSVTINTAESHSTQRAFDLTTKAGKTFHNKFNVVPPMTTAIMDGVITKLGSTLDPLNDIVEVVNNIDAVVDSYRRLNGLTPKVTSVVCVEIVSF
jgi:hypothetical protein